MYATPCIFMLHFSHSKDIRFSHHSTLAYKSNFKSFSWQGNHSTKCPHLFCPSLPHPPFWANVNNSLQTKCCVTLKFCYLEVKNQNDLLLVHISNSSFRTGLKWKNRFLHSSGISCPAGICYSTTYNSFYLILFWFWNIELHVFHPID